MTTETDFTTFDLVLAAWLTVQGYRLEIIPRSAKTVEFTAPWNAELEKDVQAFRDGSAICNPQAFHGATVDLRRKMDSVLDSWGNRGNR